MLSGIDGFHDPNVLVGFENADDAAVYLLDEKTAIVQTVDFFTPVVDDPFLYGQIAAANSLSDIYAMGGIPRFALSIIGFPQGKLGLDVLKEIVRGGSEKLAEASVPIVGGHSVQDPEMKFGYCVTGLVDPAMVYKNVGAQPGDALILTKPIGTGIITTGIKFGKSPSSVVEAAISTMLRLNNVAAAALRDFEIHATTDVTGFGLLGHAYEMALGSGVCLEIESRKVPLLTGALELAKSGMLPAGIESNRRYVGSAVKWEDVSELMQDLLLDPQTSGGLLVSLPARQSSELLSRLEEQQVPAAQIGSVVHRTVSYLHVL